MSSPERRYSCGYGSRMAYMYGHKKCPNISEPLTEASGDGKHRWYLALQNYDKVFTLAKIPRKKIAGDGSKYFV